MSLLKVNTIQNTSAAHSSTPEEIAQGRAKAWVNFNGTSTVAIRDSFNVSSITDITTGVYTVNFTDGISNNNYVTVITKRLNETGGSTSSDDVGTGLVNTAQTTSSVNVFTRNTDCIAVNVAVFGD